MFTDCCKPEFDEKRKQWGDKLCGAWQVPDDALIEKVPLEGEDADEVYEVSGGIWCQEEESDIL